LNEVNDPETKKPDIRIDPDKFGNREKWLAAALWTMPIWWMYSFGASLWAVNQLTSHFGTPLYLIVQAGWLKALLSGGLAAALVYCSRIPKWTKRHTIYTVIIWWFIVCVSGMTDGSMTAALETAAGRSMYNFNHYR
jgi:hypothetical protein